VTDPSARHRLYSDLAGWWPLISPPDEYTEEAAFVAALLRSSERPVRTLLELGSGGGHNAVHLKRAVSMTLVDLSADMLHVSRELNPECEHIQADMRTLRLHRTFDAVFVHDAVEYMTTADDLRSVMDTAFAHCEPGGLAIFMPDHTTDIFVPSSGHGGTDGDAGRAARYLEWTWDPDPADSWVETVYVFVLRGADGSVDVVHETHRTGLYPRETWLRLLGEAGFQAAIVTAQTDDETQARDVFVARRPPAR
jgi:Methyltransferase domain